ncbi:NRAMP family divalent metal transporter [Herbaspirillum seropedicae]|uniref:NRAMP family divalent metal transporter n=1 Tax=Herbaspirillum seropedicae TaxID=964 RepID=UPI003F8D8B36
MKFGSREEKTGCFDKLGPGLTTGAADDDPSGIATYSQAGAQFGFNMLWTVLFTYPLMVSIQIVSAHIGRVSGRGLATNIRLYCPAPVLYGVITLLLLANTINIAADLTAMGEALRLLIGGPAQLYATGFGLLSLISQVLIPYRYYVRLLKWLTLALLAYFGVALVVHIPWGEVALRTVMPHLSWTGEYITTVVAVFGTTISPYLFFWQASQEVEGQLATPGALPLIQAPEQAAVNLRRIKIDTYIGMGFSNVVAFFIILTAAVTLNLHGLTDIQTSAEAALALRPVAGGFAFLLFSTGILGTGLLAIPVLAGSSAYAMAGCFGWKNSLERKFMEAKAFYSVVIVSTLAGMALSFNKIDPIKALYWSAVINGVISVPIMIVMMLLASHKEVMGQFVIKPGLKIWGWLASLIMGIAVFFMLISF